MFIPVIVFLSTSSKSPVCYEAYILQFKYDIVASGFPTVLLLKQQFLGFLEKAFVSSSILK